MLAAKGRKTPEESCSQNENLANSLAAQWLGLHSFSAEGIGSIPGQETKIRQPAYTWTKSQEQQQSESLLLSSEIDLSEIVSKSYELFPLLRMGHVLGLPRWPENLPANRRLGVHPWAGKIPSRRLWQPSQYSCLENPMGRESWWATYNS